MKNIFHIGYHKTATTWFQKNFYPFVDNICIVERDKIRNYFYQHNEIEICNEKWNVFCDEELSGNIHNGGLSGFLSKDVARKISSFNNPKVIIFIRNQYDIIQSSYLQYIKEGGNYSIQKYLFHTSFDRPHRTALFSFKHFDYYSLITEYQQLIGKENVYVYLFEEFAKNKKHFTQNFIKTHQLAIDIDQINFARNNSSYSRVSYFLARILNTFTRKDVLYKYYIFHIPKFYEYARELLTRISFSPLKKQVLLNNKTKQYIFDYYKESNEKLAKNLELDLEKYGYPI